jgi:hypothetical protein
MCLMFFLPRQVGAVSITTANGSLPVHITTSSNDGAFIANSAASVTNRILTHNS